MPNIVEHKKFICVCFAETNNNKAWQITLYDNDDILVEWGRVGKAYQSKTHEGAGRSKFESLIRSKTNENNADDKRYTEVKAVDGSNSTITVSSSSAKNVNLKNIAKKQIRYNSHLVAQFIEWLTDENAHNILSSTGGAITYNINDGQFKTPMGIIIPEQVTEARDILFDLAKLVKKSEQDDSDFRKFLNQYLRLIPHDVGMRKINPFEILPDMAAVQKENDILDGLDASFSDISNGANKDTKDIKTTDEPKIFDTELSLITDRKTIRNIEDKYEQTKKGNHSCSHLKLKKVYEVIISVSKNRFELAAKKINNVHTFYHGTSSSNLLSILKIGFRVTPPSSAYITGKMFGNGIYTAPSSSKALNYSYGYWSGSRANRCFMFLVDVLVGKAYTPYSSSETFPKPGYDSTWAKSGKSGIMNDEVIVYKDDRCNPVFLLEFNS